MSFSSDDWLYIPGDVVDRQKDGGVEILVWLLEQYNVQLLLGNLEAMLLSNEFVFDEITDEYYDGITTVFGHTPTCAFDKKYNGKILKTKTWIDVDVGGYFGNPPVLLRLDDLQEFYL